MSVDDNRNTSGHDVQIGIINYKLDGVGKQVEDINASVKEISSSLSLLVLLQNKHDRLEQDFQKFSADIEAKIDEIVKTASFIDILKSNIRVAIFIISILFSVIQGSVVWYLQNNQESIKALQAEVVQLSKDSRDHSNRIDYSLNSK